MFLSRVSKSVTLRDAEFAKFKPHHGKGGRFAPAPAGRAARSDVGVKGTTGASIMDRVRQTGGLSITVKGRQPRTGYMVGTRGHNKEVPTKDFFDKEKGPKILSSYMKEHREALSQPGAHLGLWHDVTHDEVAIDISIRVSDRNEAVALGRKWNQQAIWDVAKGEEINTGGTGDRAAG